MLAREPGKEGKVSQARGAPVKLRTSFLPALPSSESRGLHIFINLEYIAPCPNPCSSVLIQVFHFFQLVCARTSDLTVTGIFFDSTPVRCSDTGKGLPAAAEESRVGLSRHRDLLPHPSPCRHSPVSSSSHLYTVIPMTPSFIRVTNAITFMIHSPSTV